MMSCWKKIIAFRWTIPNGSISVVPSIDVTFRSAADVYGPALIGLLLSGGNADGAAGLVHIHDRGGITLVQDPLNSGGSLHATAGYFPDEADIYRTGRSNSLFCSRARARIGQRHG